MISTSSKSLKEAHSLDYPGSNDSLADNEFSFFVPSHQQTHSKTMKQPKKRPGKEITDYDQYIAVSDKKIM